MKKSFYLSLRTQYENLGDYLISRATIEALSELGKVYIDIRGVPKKYIDLFIDLSNIQTTKQGFISLTRKNESWFYIVKPGGYSSEKTIKGAIKKILMTIYFKLARAKGAKIIKMPHSLSIGELKPFNLIEKKYNEAFDFILHRDEVTKQEYQKLGITNTIACPDMATYYFGAKNNIFNSNTTQRDSISISLRYDRLEERITAEKIARELSIAHGLKIKSVSQVEFDNNLNKDSATKLAATEHIAYNQTKDSITKIVATYSNSKYIISNRLHALLLGAINGAIPIPITNPEKDKKIIGYIDKLIIKTKNNTEGTIIDPTTNNSRKDLIETLNKIISEAIEKQTCTH